LQGDPNKNDGEGRSPQEKNATIKAGVGGRPSGWGVKWEKKDQDGGEGMKKKGVGRDPKPKKKMKKGQRRFGPNQESQVKKQRATLLKAG